MTVKWKYIVWLIVIQLAVFLICDITVAREVTDRTGRLISIPDNPQRVISLAPSITEIIYALGQEDRLVGATRFSDYPKSALKIPRVGSYVKLDLEKNIALQPDLCVAIKDGNPEYIISRLEEMGVPVYIIDPNNLIEVIRTIENLGIVLNSEKQAMALVKKMTKQLTQIKTRISSATNVRFS